MTKTFIFGLAKNKTRQDPRSRSRFAFARTGKKKAASRSFSCLNFWEKTFFFTSDSDAFIRMLNIIEELSEFLGMIDTHVIFDKSREVLGVCGWRGVGEGISAGQQSNRKHCQHSRPIFTRTGSVLLNVRVERPRGSHQIEREQTNSCEQIKCCVVLDRGPFSSRTSALLFEREVSFLGSYQ